MPQVCFSVFEHLKVGVTEVSLSDHRLKNRTADTIPSHFIPHTKFRYAQS